MMLMKNSTAKKSNKKEMVIIDHKMDIDENSNEEKNELTNQLQTTINNLKNENEIVYHIYNFDIIKRKQ